MVNKSKRELVSVLSGSFLTLLFLVISVLPLSAYIRALPLEELVRSSQFIVIAQVVRETVSQRNQTTKVMHLKNELRLIEPLKGSWPKDEPIVLQTVKPEKGWIEDNVKLPPPGSRVLLFLRMVNKGLLYQLAPVGGINGVWPMQGNKLSGMGFNKSLQQVRQEIRRQQPK